MPQTSAKNKKSLEIDKKLAEINRLLSPHDSLKPLNFKEEISRFSGNHNYNPRFKYPKRYTKILKKELLDIKLGSSPIEIILEKKRRELIYLINQVEKRGQKDFTKHSIKVYGKPTGILVKKSIEEIKKIIGYSEEKPLSSKDAAKIFKKNLNKLKIKNWRVQEVGQLPARMEINRSKNLLVIRKGVKFSEKEIDSLAAHEIFGHLFRLENSRRYPFKIFETGLAGFTATEEGIAMFNETKISDKYTVRIFTRVLAVDLALRHSFSKTFKELQQIGLPENIALDATARAKRGIADTSKPGALTKDYLYAKGKIMIENYFKRGGSLEELYVGRIGVRDLPLIKKLDFIKKPKYLPPV